MNSLKAHRKQQGSACGENDSTKARDPNGNTAAPAQWRHHAVGAFTTSWLPDKTRFKTDSSTWDFSRLCHIGRRAYIDVGAPQALPETSQFPWNIMTEKLTQITWLPRFMRATADRKIPRSKISEILEINLFQKNQEYFWIWNVKYFLQRKIPENLRLI